MKDSCENFMIMQIFHLGYCRDADNKNYYIHGI